MKANFRRVGNTIVPRKGWHFVECPGSAHSNPYIDHCMICVPLWNRVAIPNEYTTFREWAAAEAAKQDAAWEAEHVVKSDPTS